MRLSENLKSQRGYSLIEGIVVSTIMVLVITAAYNLLIIGYKMDKQAEDGFEAQTEGREVLTQLAKLIRPAEDMNLTGVPVLFAGNDGTFLDVRVDVNNDYVTELVRFDLDRTNKQIKKYTDSADTTGPSVGKFNFEKAGQAYSTYYNHPTNPARWDTVEVLANKIVNVPGNSGTSTTPWAPQTSVTDPDADDYRLFTFYGENFALPLDTRDASPGLGPNWINYVKGIKIYLLSDIRPAEIPSPFGTQTNVNLRNISKG